jgi:hypothetical protein
MVENGFPPERIAEVRGFADRQLRYSGEPENPANRRISLIVLYDDQPDSDTGSQGSAAAGQPAAGEGPGSSESTPAAEGAQSPAPQGSSETSQPPAPSASPEPAASTAH